MELALPYQAYVIVLAPVAETVKAGAIPGHAVYPTGLTVILTVCVTERVVPTDVKDIGEQFGVLSILVIDVILKVDPC